MAEARDFFEHPILNSPYREPQKHHVLDDRGQPLNRVVASRRKCDLMSPYPKPKKTSRKKSKQLDLGEVNQAATAPEEDGVNYHLTAFVNGIRQEVANWRRLPNPNQWGVTPTSRRLLDHWRNHDFQRILTSHRG